MTNKELFQAIHNMDQDQLSSDDLLTFSAILPTLDELKLVQKYAKEEALEFPLAPAERFAVETLDYPGLSQKILSFLFVLQYPIELEEITLKVSKLDAICISLKSSDRFKALLKIILELGNMTNYQYASHSSSYRPWMGNQARALGFRIDGLARLADVKSGDGKWNLMMFLVDMIEKQSPELLDIAEEFQEVGVVKNYDVQAIALQIKNLSTTQDKVSKLEFSDNFHEKLGPILIDATRQVQECSRKFREFISSWTDVMAYLGEDLDDYILPSLDPRPIGQTVKKFAGHLFVALDMFLSAYKAAVAQNRIRNQMNEQKMERKRRAEKERELQELREMRRRAREAESETGSPESQPILNFDDEPSPLTQEPEEMNYDDLLEPNQVDFDDVDEQVPEMLNRLSLLPPVQDYEQYDALQYNEYHEQFEYE